MNISRETLVAALAAFKIERQKIDDNISEVEALLGGRAKATAAIKEDSQIGSKRGRGKRSAAVRRKMALAQKARWATLKGESGATPEPVQVKRKMSAAGRKAIGDATRKRWAAKKAAGKKAARAAKKPATE